MYLPKLSLVLFTYGFYGVPNSLPDDIEMTSSGFVGVKAAADTLAL